MRISKAREIIDLNLKVAGDKMPPDVRAALVLLEEAGGRIEYQRTMNPPICQPPLKHETPD